MGRNNNPTKNLAEKRANIDLTESRFEELYEDINELERYVAMNDQPDEEKMEHMAVRICTNLEKLRSKTEDDEEVKQVGRIVTDLAQSIPSLESGLKNINPAIRKQYGINL